MIFFLNTTTSNQVIRFQTVISLVSWSGSSVSISRIDFIAYPAIPTRIESRPEKAMVKPNLAPGPVPTRPLKIFTKLLPGSKPDSKKLSTKSPAATYPKGYVTTEIVYSNSKMRTCKSGATLDCKIAIYRLLIMGLIILMKNPPTTQAAMAHPVPNTKAPISPHKMKLKLIP